MGIKRFPYDFSIIISFCLFLGILYMIGIHIFVPFLSELSEFTKSLPNTFTELQKTILEMQQTYNLNVLPPEIQGFITKMVQEVGEYTFANLFASFFPEQYQAHIKTMINEIHFVLKAYIHGQLLLSVLMAFVVFIGMWILDIPYPLVIGLLAGVVEMIPVIGPIIGAIPPILLGLLQGTGTMIQVIIFYVVVQQLDSHLVMPKLMGSIIEVHPVAIIAGVLIGGSLYGVIGMMIAVPTVAVLQIFFRHMWYYDKYKLIK